MVSCLYSENSFAEVIARLTDTCTKCKSKLEANFDGDGEETQLLAGLTVVCSKLPELAEAANALGMVKVG